MGHIDKQWLAEMIKENTRHNPKTKCLEWTGSFDKHGYGQRRIGSRENNKMYRAHRLSYYLKYGEITQPNVNHKCDNPTCVNPEHLYEGTQQQNMRDKKDRGTTKGIPYQEFRERITPEQS